MVWEFFKPKRKSRLCIGFFMASILTLFVLFLLSIVSVSLNEPSQQILRLEPSIINATQSAAFELESHPMENECRFPIISNSEPDINKKYVQDLSNFTCPRDTNHTYFKQQLNGDVFVVPGQHQCFYRKLTGSIKPEKYSTFRFDGEWTKFLSGKNITVNADQFVVQCMGRNLDTNVTSLLVHDVFNNVRKKLRLNPPFIDDPNDPHKLSFVFLVMDSVSRTQFKRHMPKTLSFIEQNDFQILDMYNKVGDNSLINLLPILSGKVYEKTKHDVNELVRDEMALKLNETRSDRALEYADMLLHVAQKKGYATMFNDEIMRHDLGLMQYDGWKGFNKPPADYYFRPYYNYLYKTLMPKGKCINGELYSNRVISTFERFSTVYAKQAHFSFNFITKLTHDDPWPLQLADGPLSEALERLKANGLFENAVVFIMGDHGNRISAIQYAYTGRIEERTPFMSIHIPAKYRNAFKEKYRNLATNRNRLTSNFDIHEMLRELMQLPTKNVGISLFNKISTQRHCEHARIPPNFCMCMETLDTNLLAGTDKDFMAIMVADQINKEINQTSCAHRFTDLKPLAYQPYTINLQARTGSRSYKDFLKYLKKHNNTKLTDNQIVDVEVDSELFINFKNDKRPPAHVMVRSRIIFNRKNRDMRMIAKPMLISTKCPVKRLKQLCQCTEF